MCAVVFLQPTRVLPLAARLETNDIAQQWHTTSDATRDDDDDGSRVRASLATSSTYQDFSPRHTGPSVHASPASIVSSPYVVHFVSNV